MADGRRGGRAAAPRAHLAHATKRARPPRAWSAGDLVWLLLVVSALGLSGQFADRAMRPAAVPPRDSVSVVRARNPLAAFTRLAPGDVDTVRVARAPAGALAPDSALVGRVMVADLAAGAMLTRTSLRALPGEWWVLPLPVDTALPVRLGDSVALLGTPANGFPLQGVVLGRRGERVLLGVRSLPPSATAFADSVLRLARRIPPETPSQPADTASAAAESRRM
jgi:hypothetical protein